MKAKDKSLTKKIVLFIVAILCATCMAFVFSGCSENVYITKIEKTSSVGYQDNYTIFYSNGTTSNFSVTNGKDGQDGDDVTIDEVYQKYVQEYGEISYADFLKAYLSTYSNNSKIINECLQSSLKVYTEFKVTTSYYTFYGVRQSKSVSVMCGSSIIYKIEDDYTYCLTNYHVVYNSDANSDNGSKIANKIVGYLYGSESEPTDSGTMENDYTVYDYGDYGIEFEYVGGSVDYDIAVLKVETSKIMAVNPNIKAVEIANDYHVGETAIAIGNPENEGISVSQGVVSVDNEYIVLSIDGNKRSYRSIRMDTAIYGGSSGGGLFNCYGELIGLTNAGDNNDQNINYAIPIEIVTGVADNILRNYDGTNPTTVKKITLGIEVDGTNSKYVYDQTTGYGEIVETITITNVVSNSIANTLELQVGDIINSIYINNIEYELNRYFEIGDLTLNIKAGDEIKINYTRNNVAQDTAVYSITSSDIK